MLGVRQRRRRRLEEPQPAAVPPVPQDAPARRRSHAAHQQTPSYARIYCFLSAVFAMLAVLTAPVHERGPIVPVAEPFLVTSEHKGEDWGQWFKSSWFPQETTAPAKQQQQQQQSQLPGWLRWLDNNNKNDRPKPEDTKQALPLAYLKHAFRWLRIDPTILKPSPNTLTDLLDKILTSTIRLLAIANYWLAATWQLHTSLVHYFLGSPVRNLRYTHEYSNKWGGFLLFKLLLISAVVAPDTLDLLILLSWYTLLSFLRSLSTQAHDVSVQTAAAGQAPVNGVLQLLLLILVSDCMAAALCVALFHGAGLGMVILLTSDCALVLTSVVQYLLQHLQHVLEVQHVTAVQHVQDEQARQRQRQQQQGHVEGEELPVAPENHGDVNTGEASVPSQSLSEEVEDETAVPAPTAQPQPQDRVHQLPEPPVGGRAPPSRRLEALEQLHARRLSVLDTTIFGLQLLAHALTIGHFCHIWSLHGVQFSLIDGVLCLHLHSAISSATRKIAERRNLHRIARDLDGLFEDASELDLRKAAAVGDVCCICLLPMSTGTVKKVGCGHLYHTTCLREVVERARSLEAARCPLCRASVVDGRHQAQQQQQRQQQQTRGADARATGAAVVPAVNNGNDQPQPLQARQNANVPPGDDALFRFSTEGILPAWLPLPAFSFEVVRRPPVVADAVNATANRGNGNGGADENAMPRPPPNPIAANAVQDQQQQQQQSLLRRFLVLAGAIPMSPEEEAAAMDQLVDMFPQHNRGDLLRELRDRGSAELVAEAVLAGSLAAAPQGPANWQGGAIEEQ